MILGAILCFEMVERAMFHAHTLYKYSVYKYMKLSFKFNLRFMEMLLKWKIVEKISELQLFLVDFN